MGVTSVCSLINFSVVRNNFFEVFRRFILDGSWVQWTFSSKMNCSLKCDKHKKYPMYLCSHRDPSSHPSTFEFQIFRTFWSFRVFWISLVPRCYKMCLKLISLDDSETSDLYLLMNSWASLCHPWELDAASGLEFWSVLAPSLPDNPTCRLEALSMPRVLDAIGLFTDQEIVALELTRGHRRRLWLRHNPVFFWSFLHPIRHPFGAA